jgi:SpoVK/Ycf46/Vps4 family AAA+-type ATPase
MGIPSEAARVNILKVQTPLPETCRQSAWLALRLLQRSLGSCTPTLHFCHGTAFLLGTAESVLGQAIMSDHMILIQVLARRLRLAGDFDFKLIAQRTPGFVGADLQALTKEAAAIAIKRIFAQLGALPHPGAAVEDLLEAGAVSTCRSCACIAACPCLPVILALK